MQPGNAGIYECKGKNSDRGMHRWVFDDKAIATCSFCDLELSAEDSDDLRGANERWNRELAKSRLSNK